MITLPLMKNIICLYHYKSLRELIYFWRFLSKCKVNFQRIRRPMAMKTMHNEISASVSKSHVIWKHMEKTIPTIFFFNIRFKLLIHLLLMIRTFVQTSIPNNSFYCTISANSYCTDDVKFITVVTLLSHSSP